jgi:endonuclease III
MPATRASSKAAELPSDPGIQQLPSPPTTSTTRSSNQGAKKSRNTRSKVDSSTALAPIKMAPKMTPKTTRKRKLEAAQVTPDSPEDGEADLAIDDLEKAKKRKHLPSTPDDSKSGELAHGMRTKLDGDNSANAGLDQVEIAQLSAVASKPSNAGPGNSASSPQKKLAKKAWKKDPFPDWERPTPEECHEVVRLLTSVHGDRSRPDEIPPASKIVAGCGEVRSVLEALLRTRLSASTTMKNANTAIQGLVEAFPAAEDKIGDEAVDWDLVRRSPIEDLERAIQRGGQQKIKSRDIKSILDVVYQENLSRRKAMRDEVKANDMDSSQTPPKTPDAEEPAEAEVPEQNLLSLQHLYFWSNDDIFEKLCSYRGIGVKTATCVMLFCLKRDTFAVDTHVDRLCNWLGWVPPSANGKPVHANDVFFHCDPRIPDELKYQLHQLLLRHGKECPRCRAITSQSSKGWQEGCILDDVLTRTGLRKTAPPKVKGSKKTKKTKRKTGDDSDEDVDAASDGEDNNVTTKLRSEVEETSDGED